MTRWVYAFGGGRADGRADMVEKLGGKGANLAEMSAIGLPVPPGLTIVSKPAPSTIPTDAFSPMASRLPWSKGCRSSSD